MLKRQRSVSSASSSSSASFSSSSSSPSTSARPSESPASKLSRLPPSLSSSSHTCSLPPTCDAHPPTFASAEEVESHYRKLHSLVCECEVDAEPADGTLERGGNEKGKARAHRRKCGAIFPEQRLMDLHFAEFHDPVRAVQRDQGQRTYECYLGDCDKKSHTPKGRRLHLIDGHGFPKTYFFAVVKVGIGPLLRTQGPAASLLRPEYNPSTPRSPSHPSLVSSNLTPEPPISASQRTSSVRLDSTSSATTTPPPPPSRDAPPHLLPPTAAPADEAESAMDSLTSSLASASLAFVPRSVGSKAKAKAKGVPKP